MSTNAYIPGALTESTDLQRIRLESISLCRGLLAAWKLVFYLTCSPPRVELQPEIFQASSVPERELDNTVPLKYVPIGSTVFARKDIEEGCVIPLSQKRFPQSRTKKQLFDSCSMPASTAATFMRHFASLARTSSWKPHSVLRTSAVESATQPTVSAL